MKKTIIFFAVLLIVFFASWGIKANVLVSRPENVESEAKTPWYLQKYDSPVVDSEWTIDPTIPDNYVPVPGEVELYMVVDTSGKITSYMHREKQSDGSWKWEEVNPAIPDEYVKVEGSDNLYAVKKPDGTVEYFLYVRNEDDTYAFVPANEFGVPYYDGEDADVIANNFENVDGNIYAVKNDKGIKEGYVERVKEDDGTHKWKAVDEPKFRKYESETTEAPKLPKVEIEPDKTTEAATERLDDGTYTKKNTQITTETKDGFVITYQTTVINTYDKNDKLLFTSQEGPIEIKREKVSSANVPDQSLIKDTLDEEYKRVTSLVAYDKDLANQVLANLNAERTAAGLNTLKMSKKSEAYKLACIRAGDMATYPQGEDGSSPMYGTLDDMVSKWGVSTDHASECVWKASNKTADQIHSRLQAYEGSRNVRMSDSYTEVGIAIVIKDSQLYIAEIYLK